MEAIYILIGLVVIVCIVSFVKTDTPETNDDIQNTDRPQDAIKPPTTVKNDKLVVVNHVKLEELKLAIKQFCNLYNQQSYKALPSLTIIADREFVITFPYDIEFEIFCYFVNYLHYPHDIFYQPNIRAWTTTSENDEWMKADIIGKCVMLYIPEDDQQHDNVHLTSSDNIGYKITFAKVMGEENQRQDKPSVSFQKPTRDLNSLSSNETLEFD